MNWNPHLFNRAEAAINNWLEVRRIRRDWDRDYVAASPAKRREMDALMVETELLALEGELVARSRRWKL
jgi:hypothetical protein